MSIAINRLYRPRGRFSKNHVSFVTCHQSPVTCHLSRDHHYMQIQLLWKSQEVWWCGCGRVGDRVFFGFFFIRKKKHFFVNFYLEILGRTITIRSLNRSPIICYTEGTIDNRLPLQLIDWIGLRVDWVKIDITMALLLCQDSLECFSPDLSACTLTTPILS